MRKNLQSRRYFPTSSLTTWKCEDFYTLPAHRDISCTKWYTQERVRGRLLHQHELPISLARAIHPRDSPCEFHLHWAKLRRGPRVSSERRRRISLPALLADMSYRSSFTAAENSFVLRCPRLASINHGELSQSSLGISVLSRLEGCLREKTVALEWKEQLWYLCQWLGVSVEQRHTYTFHFSFRLFYRKSRRSFFTVVSYRDQQNTEEEGTAAKGSVKYSKASDKLK